MAEEEGFEPPVGLPTTVFKTVALSRSAIPPQCFRPKELDIPTGSGLSINLS